MAHCGHELYFLCDGPRATHSYVSQTCFKSWDSFILRAASCPLMQMIFSLLQLPNHLHSASLFSKFYIKVARTQFTRKCLLTTETCFELIQLTNWNDQFVYAFNSESSSKHSGSLFSSPEFVHFCLLVYFALFIQFILRLGFFLK